MTAHKRTWLVATLALAYGCSSGCKQKPVEVSGVRATTPVAATPDTVDLSRLDQQFYQAVSIFDRYLRDPQTGLFYDRLFVESSDTGKVTRSDDYSTAAVGIGLIAMAMGDLSGIVTDGPAKIKQALKSIETFASMNKGSHPIQKQGWFLHWFSAAGFSAMSQADGYSTIDTTLMLIGADMAARYVADRYQDQEALAIVQRLANAVQWPQAIAGDQVGGLRLKFEVGSDFTPAKAVTNPFNEYVLIPCFARSFSPDMARLWTEYYADPGRMPKKVYEDKELLVDHPDFYIPNFHLQFAYYMCRQVRESQAYRQFIVNAYQADRGWGQRGRQPGTPLLWGHGAGSAFRYETGSKQEAAHTYEANSFRNNPMEMASAAIMAGFLPFDSQTIAKDLMDLGASGHCRYRVGELTTLWRCSRLNVVERVRGLEAVDYSTLLFGLSTVQSGPVSQFFEKYGVH